MKFLFVFILLSQYSLAKDIIHYECSISPELKLELSFLDPKNPSINIQKNNVKITRCFYQTMPVSKIKNKMFVSTDVSWSLRFLKCDTYYDKLKDKLKFSKLASFKQSEGLSHSYLRLFEDQQPLLCKPKK